MALRGLSPRLPPRGSPRPPECAHPEGRPPTAYAPAGPAPVLRAPAPRAVEAQPLQDRTVGSAPSLAQGSCLLASRSPPRPRTGVRVTCRRLLASRPPRGRTGSTAPGGVRGRVFLGEMPERRRPHLTPRSGPERVTCWPGALCWRREEAVRAGGGTGRGRCPGQAGFFFHRPNILWSTTPGIQFLDLLFGNLAPP